MALAVRLTPDVRHGDTVARGIDAGRRLSARAAVGTPMPSGCRRTSLAVLI
jgi:hypothetical protein